MFEIYDAANLQDESGDQARKGKKPQSRSDQDQQDVIDKSAHLKLRTYSLMDFVKKFMRPIEMAINKVGTQFIEENCVEKMREKEDDDHSQVLGFPRS